MKPNVLLLGILLFLSPAALGNNAGDDTDALLIAATYIYRRRERDDLPRIRHQPAGCGIYVQKRQNLQRRRQVHPVARRPVYDQRRKNFRGNNTWPYDAAYSIEGERIYRGNARFASWFDVLFTVRDGQFYIGDSSFILDIAYSVRDGRVYEGRGSSQIRYSMCCIRSNTGLLSIGGNPGARNLQTGRRKYTVYPDLS